MLLSWTAIAVLIARPDPDREQLGGAHNTGVHTSTTAEERLKLRQALIKERVEQAGFASSIDQIDNYYMSMATLMYRRILVLCPVLIKLINIICQWILLCITEFWFCVQY